MLQNNVAKNADFSKSPDQSGINDCRKKEQKQTVVDVIQNKSYIERWKNKGYNNVGFSPDGALHLTQFLKKLKQTFEKTGVPEEAKISFAVEGLKGSAAQWA